MRKILILGLLALSACCDNDDRDCSAGELADKYARQDGVAQLVSIQDNVKLYRIWTKEPQANNHWTYFTTPCGDVSAQIDYTRMAGKIVTHHQIPSNVNGTGCQHEQ